ncbi:MAG: alpha/beta hydrolase, partial [Actinomycetes bacterium]
VGALVALAAISRVHQVDKPWSERLMFDTVPGLWLLGQASRYATRQVVKATLSKEAALTREQLAEQLEYVMSDDAQREFVLTMVRTMSFRPPRRAGRDNDKVQFAGIKDLALERVVAPVLLVHGEVDTEVSPNDSYSASARLPNAELVMVPQGGHACAFVAQDAETVQERIRQFLRCHC